MLPSSDARPSIPHAPQAPNIRVPDGAALAAFQACGRVGLWQRQVDAARTEWDEPALRMFGFDAASTPDLGDALARVHSDVRDTVRAHHLESLHRVGRFECRFRVVRPDATVTLLHSMWEVHAGADGQPERAVGVLVDDTLSLETARHHEVSQRHFKLAADLANLSLWRIDTVTKRIFANDLGFDLVGIAPPVDGIPVEELRSVIHPDDRPGMARAAEEAVQCGVPVDMEARYRFPDGQYRSLLTRRVADRDADGRVIGLVGVSMDITERKRAEAVLVQNQRRQKMAMDSAGVGLWDWHVPSGHVDFDARWAEIIGYRLDELAPDTSTWARIDHPDDREMIVAQMASHLRGETTEFSYEHRLHHKAGHWVWVRNTGIVLERDDKGQAIRLVGTYRDITDAKHAEIELRQAKDAADAANAAKSEFLANMSHEIRTPMNAIIGLTHVVLGSELNARQRDFLQKVHGSSKALLSILNDILDYSKIEAGRMVIERLQFALEEPLNNVANLFGAQVEQKGLELFFEIAPDAPMEVMGDALRLTQVLNNLVSNAIKFTERGVIHIKVEVASEDERGHLLRFAVKDTGIGVSKVQAERLFQAFVQADNSVTRTYGGTGLGLTISQQLVELMGGQITLSSQPGRGCTFSFTVRAGRVQSPHLSLDIHRLRGLRALVVDDQETSREILESMFLAWGMEVDTVSGAEPGLSRIEATRRAGRPYDVVLLDWCMPGMDGLEMVRRLRADGGATHCPPFAIMVTAFSADKLAQEAGDDVPLDVVLTKPVVPSHLFDILMQLRQPQRIGPTPHATAPVALRFPGAQILLVEDNALNQDVAIEFLSEFDVTVTVAGNGLEALQLAEARAGDFHLVLMDMHMPVMDGLEATRRILELPQAAGLPIVAMTAAVMGDDRSQCDAAGMVDFVAKPVDPDDLIRVMRRWLPTGLQQTRGTATPAPAVEALAAVSGASVAAAVMPAATSALPFALPGFEPGPALRRLHGNDDFLQRLLCGFAGQQGGAVARLEHLLANGDLHQAALDLHTLKGTASTLGLMRQALLAQQLEAELKAQAEPASFQAFADSMGEAMAAIERMQRRDVPAVPPQGATTKVVDAPAVVRLLIQLRHYLDEQELVPDALLDELKHAALADLPGAPLGALDAQIFNFEHDAALRSIDALVDLLALHAETAQPIPVHHG